MWSADCPGRWAVMPPPSFSPFLASISLPKGCTYKAETQESSLSWLLSLPHPPGYDCNPTLKSVTSSCGQQAAGKKGFQSHQDLDSCSFWCIQSSGYVKNLCPFYTSCISHQKISLQDEDTTWMGKHSSKPHCTSQTALYELTLVIVVTFYIIKWIKWA